MPNRSDPTKKLKLGDYVEVLVPLGSDEDGNPTYEKGIVSRAGLSDEKWADVKSRAESSGRLSTIAESEKTRGASSDVEGDVIRFKDKSGGTVVVPRGDLDDAAWSKRIAAAADKDSFESAVQGGDVVKAGPSRAKKVDTGNLADEGATPVQAKQTLVEPAPSGVRGFFSNAIKGALPGPPGMGTPPGPIPPGQGSVLEAAGDVMGLPPAQGQEIPAAAPGPDFATASGTSQALGGGYAASPTDAVKKAGASLLGPSPGAQTNDLVEAGRQSVQPQLQPSAPAPAPVPAPAPTDVSLSVSGRGGPSAGPGGTPSLAGAEDAFMKSQAVAQETAEAGARERLRARAQFEGEAQAFQAEQKKAQMRQREEEDRINSAYLQTLEEFSKKQEIDPNHMWDSKSAGQKAFMAIGGFLAGLGGRDPSGRIDQMIAQDIAVQRENFNLAREGAKNKLAGLSTMYGRLRERGLDDREAAAATRAAMNEAMARRLENIADQMAPGEAQAKAQMAVAQFRMNKVKAEDDLKTSAQQRVHMRNQDGMASFAAQMKLREAQDKAAGGGKEESPGTRSQIAQIDQALDAIDRLLSDSSKVGAFQQFADAQTQLIRGILPESAERLFDQMFPSVSQRERRAAEVGGTAKKAVTGEALSGEERKQAESNVPRPGFTQNQDAAVKELRQQLLAKRKSLENTRFSVGTAPTQDTSFTEQSGP